ncbi:MFS transporter [Amycolatopsis sp. QT-25]|uniref:MFS transporter n=1 Tax=Amycolatopsis sp. QT-25 TaxID=3034022 RepID=UPI0023ED7F12|nr:MFS transporter [Amycolatopsis sp. QT-25]WET82561.1 MFS transporter [Amycolatopsis sp. QT-25]
MSASQTTTPGVGSDQVEPRGLTGRRRLMLVAVMTGTFLSMLNDFIVNVATPAIRTDLNTSFSEIQLIIGGYVLVYGLLLVLAGRLGDIHGHRKLFLIGSALFSVASLACGLAPNPSMLVVFRVAQAVGAALLYPQVLSILQLSFTGKQRATVFAVYGTTISLASIAGQLIGGVLVEANLFDLGWRTVFLINVPVGLATLAIAAVSLPRTETTARPKLDLPGLGLLTLTLALLTFPLIQGREFGWPAWLIAMLVLTAPALAAFLAYEQRRTTQGRFALVPPALFRIRTFSAGNAIALIFFAGNSGLFFLLPLQLQNGLGHSALYAGLTFSPLAVAFGLGSMLALRIQTRVGNHVLSIGYAINVVGNVILLVCVIAAGPDMTGLLLAPALFVVGLGQGLGVSPLIGAALKDVPEGDAGSASGVIQTLMQVGVAFGVAVIGLIFFSVLGSATDPQSYSTAFTWALVASPLLSLLSLLLVPALIGKKRNTA